MVCAQHQFGAAKHLPVPLVRQAHTDNLLSLIPSFGLGFTLGRLGQFINPIFQNAVFPCVLFIGVLVYQIFSRGKDPATKADGLTFVDLALARPTGTETPAASSSSRSSTG